jgi:Ca2+-binding RTX toxin-like protein
MAHYTGTADGNFYSGTAESDIIEGFDGDDTLYDGPSSASSIADQIYCGNGDDVAGTRGGADTISGGLGQDRLVITYDLSSTALFLNIDEDTGNSIQSSNGLSITGIERFEIYLGSGNDTVSAGGGDDTFSGNGGNDTFFGLAGSDIAYGGLGEDHLYGGADRDHLNGGADDDVLYGGLGNDNLSGSDGNDELHGGGGDDYMSGGAGADQFYGDSGIDIVSYSASSGVIVDLGAGTGDNGYAEGDTYGGIEALYGSNFGDTLAGSGNSDKLYGGDGSDVLRGGAGADDLSGGAGTDTASYYTGSVGVVVGLVAGTGSGGDAQGDTLSGIENLSGSQGHDSLVGTSGANTLQGWNGNDVLTGAGGKDTLTGGAGADRFVYGGVGQSVVGADADRITDFSHAQADKIDLSAIDASIAASGNQPFQFIGADLYTGVAGQLRYASDGATTTIAGDVNGDGSSDFHIQLTGAIALVAGDFML